MNRTLLALMLAVCSVASAQVQFNPDSDGDHLIGIADLLEVLTVFGTSFVPAEYCSGEAILWNPDFGSCCSVLPIGKLIVFTSEHEGELYHSVEIPSSFGDGTPVCDGYEMNILRDGYGNEPLHLTWNSNSQILASATFTWETSWGWAGTVQNMLTLVHFNGEWYAKR